MTKHRNILSAAVTLVMSCAALCLAESAGTDGEGATGSRNWSPPPIEPGAYDDITAYNIFAPDRADLVAQAEHVPEVPEDPGPPEPVIELPPPDPDASLMLVGISVRGGRPTAFIEDRATGETVEIDSVGAFSQGEITHISFNQITYAIDDETRTIRVGYALTGERPQAPAPARPAPGSSAGPDDATDGSSDSSSETPGADGDGLTDLERRMRERRRSE